MVFKISNKFEKYLNNYIEVIVKKALNLQPNQRLLIMSPFDPGVPIELAYFIKLIVKKAYEEGARLVEVMWRDDQIQLARYAHAPRDSLEEFSHWRSETAEKFLEKGDAVLFIYAEDPDIFKNIDPELLSITQQALFKNIKPLLDKISKNLSNWVMISAPIDGWSNKLFSEIPQERRKESFWDLMFEICRVKNDDPLLNWDIHIDQLNKRGQYLTRKKYSALKLQGPGTDITIGLPEGHIWLSGSEVNRNGITFIANIPTEEVFTTPDKNNVNGFVSCSKPLFFGGRLVEEFKLTFSEGKIIEVTAKQGVSLLNDLINSDEGSSRIGEIALVPHSSPISSSGKLFYNILIDENAASHIALGFAYRSSIDGGENMTDDEFKEAGGNLSGIHIDFMVGSADLNVDGVLKNGTIEPIMKDGEWTFNM
ncbi:MAG: aminopeptidase [Candidatus Lokiarchaeota archaeon]|nr:aminopeptidase [Candidatus Lokiarchaeota archaeon]